MLDGLTQRLGVGQVIYVGWANTEMLDGNTEAECRTGDIMLDGLTQRLGVGQVTDVGWANTEAGCRTDDRCWMG